MALTTSQTQTGYYVAKFAGSKANVFIYRDGLLGIRRQISINSTLREDAEADLDDVNMRIGKEQIIFTALNLGDNIPDFARLFTPQPTDLKFFAKYNWYSFQNKAAAHAILLQLAPLG